MKTIIQQCSFTGKDRDVTLEQFLSLWTDTLKQTIRLCDTLEDIREQEKALAAIEALVVKKFNSIYEFQNKTVEPFEADQVIEQVEAVEVVEAVTTINDIKQGEFFKRRESTNRIYEKGAYCRTNKAYECINVNDINKVIYIKSKKPIFIDFEY